MPPTASVLLIGDRKVTTVRAKLLTDRTKLVEARSEPAEQRALEIIANDYMARGHGRTGAEVEARHERRINSLQDVLAERMRLEREQSLAAEDVTAWYDALVDDIRQVMGRATGRLLDAAGTDWTNGLGGHLPHDVRAKFEQQIQRIEKEYLADAQLLREQRRVGHPSEMAGPTMITINISQSQVAGLNLGHVIGNIEGSVRGLNIAGHGDLADAIMRLTEIIAAESSLAAPDKREAVELVSALSEELTRPPEQARRGVLRSVATGLGQIVSGIAAAQGAYEALKLAARAAGYELP